MACQAENTYYLVLFRKTLLAPERDDNDTQRDDIHIYMHMREKHTHGSRIQDLDSRICSLSFPALAVSLTSSSQCPTILWFAYMSRLSCQPLSHVVQREKKIETTALDLTRLLKPTQVGLYSKQSFHLHRLNYFPLFLSDQRQTQWAFCCKDKLLKAASFANPWKHTVTWASSL